MKLKYGLTRMICIYSNMSLFLMTTINLFTSFLDFGVCSNIGSCPVKDLIISSVRCFTHILFMFSLYTGFYGLLLYNKYMIKYHVYCFIFALIGAYIVIAGYLYFGVQVEHYIGQNYINSSIVKQVKPLKHKLDPTFRIVHSIQIYFKCCGWESYTEWNTSSAFWPASCCLHRFTDDIANPLFHCGPKSQNFHFESCKTRMNRYIVRANRLNKYSFVVAVGVTLGTLPLSLLLMKRVHSVDPKFSYYPNPITFIVWIIETPKRAKLLWNRLRGNNHAGVQSVTSKSSSEEVKKVPSPTLSLSDPLHPSHNIVAPTSYILKLQTKQL